MCGIVYAEDFNGKPVNNDIMQIFDAQRHRGTEGFGLFDGQEMNMVHETKEDKILKWLVKYDSSRVMFHHRMPSSTVNVKRAAHPFSTKDYFGDTQYVLVHNGHLHNSYEVQEEHAEMGIEYHSILDDGTFNDTEALLWDFALTMEGKQAGLTVEGKVAFICLKIVKGKLERMYFGRNTNPLKMVRNKDVFRLSSEGEGEMIESDVLYNYNYSTKRLTQKQFTIPEYTPTRAVVPYQSHSWEDEDDYYVPKRQAGTAGNWLPEYLRNKYRRTLDRLDANRGSSIENDPNFIDYDADGVPVWKDNREYSSYDAYWEQRKLRESRTSMLTQEQEEELETVETDTDEVYQLAFEYLCQSEGNFEQAYFFAEQDYEQMFDVPEIEQDAEYLRQVRTMELVMSEINSDPEYVDEQSVSSTWLPLSQQMLKV